MFRIALVISVTVLSSLAALADTRTPFSAGTSVRVTTTTGVGGGVLRLGSVSVIQQAAEPLPDDTEEALESAAPTSLWSNN